MIRITYYKIMSYNENRKLRNLNLSQLFKVNYKVREYNLLNVKKNIVDILNGFYRK